MTPANASRMEDRDRGFTLVETGIAGMLLSLVLAIALGLLHSGQVVVSRQQERSANNDQVRLAIQQLDREIRSGNLVYPPKEESPQYQTLRVFTQSNTVPRCVQWRIDNATRTLQRRSWTPNHGIPNPSPTSWRVVAEGIVDPENREDPAKLDYVPFDSTQQDRTVGVTLRVNEDPANHESQTVEVRTSITGRNTVATFPLQACNPAPAA